MKKLHELLQRHGVSEHLIEEIKELWTASLASDVQTVRLDEGHKLTLPLNHRDVQPIELHPTLVTANEEVEETNS